MDIDKDFIRGLGIPPNEKTPKSKMGSIDVELPSEEETVSSKPIATTPDEAILAMEANSIITEKPNDVVETEESATIIVATEKKNMSDETEPSTSVLPVSEESFELIATIGDNVEKLLGELTALRASVLHFDGYDKAVDTLKRSLAANQRNEENIYKELEVYRKNQYYTYIRPFLEFLISLLTDLLSSLKQYEDDKDEFIESHGQEMYNEIINLHKYYTQQIESQLQIQGVEVIHFETGTPFIATEQIISKTILTDDSNLSGIVGKIDSACYKFEEKVLKKAKVHVYKYKPTDNK